MTKDLQDKARTGIERFYDKYPNYPRIQNSEDIEYLGVGAMMIPLNKPYEKENGKR